MYNVVLYDILLLGCWSYAMLRGGLPEQIGATILALGSILTVMTVSGPADSFKSVETGIFLVDVAVLVAFLILALRAERFWPLWVAALQIIGTAGHLAKFADPEIIRRAYAFILAFWSYPMIILLVVGTWRHQQRLIRFGTDKSWSYFRK